MKTRKALRKGKTALAEGFSGRGAQFLQDHRQGTETGESGLSEIGTDKGGEPEPVDMMHLRQGQTGEDENTGKSENQTVNRHEILQ